MKEIHFYTNLVNEYQVSDWDLESMHVDLATTIDAIKNDDIVKTTQIALLRNAWDYIGDGAKVYFHNGTRTMEIYDSAIAPTGKEIKKGTDVSRLVMGGAFGKIE